jgi:hypothetical protein
MAHGHGAEGKMIVNQQGVAIVAGIGGAAGGGNLDNERLAVLREFSGSFYFLLQPVFEDDLDQQALRNRRVLEPEALSGSCREREQVCLLFAQIVWFAC